MFKYQYGGYNYHNPHNIANTALNTLLTTPMAFYNDRNLAISMGHSNPNQMGTVGAINQSLTGLGTIINQGRDGREVKQNVWEDELRKYINTTPYYNTFNSGTVSNSYFKHGGQKRQKNQKNDIFKVYKPIYDRTQRVKNSNGSDLAALWGTGTPRQLIEGWVNSKPKGFYSNQHPMNRGVRKDFRTSPNRLEDNLHLYKYSPLNPSEVSISPNGYYDNPNANNYVVPTNGSITMKGVPPMVGTSLETGESKLMLPNKEYFFKNTQNVLEQKLTNSLPKRFKNFK